MRLADLTAYAEEKYHIPEQHKWADFPGFSVLADPASGRWIALLMRQWDTDTGTEIERCDLKCGGEALFRFRRPFLTPPLRMRGKRWVGIAFDEGTEEALVFRLFDEAVSAGAGHRTTVILDSRPGATLILEPKPGPAALGGYRETALPFAETASPAEGRALPSAGALPPRGETAPSPAGSVSPAAETVLPSAETGSLYTETALPFAGSPCRPELEAVPARLREMKRLYEYGRETQEARAKNFYRQARFMEDYEDDLPWEGNFLCYFPTYHDLSLRQLRGYFTWRARLRRGDWQPVPDSAAYLYLYELLNGVGAGSPEEVLEKLREFEAGYLDAGFGDARMRGNLRRWMLEYAVLRDLPAELARESADPELLEEDRALAALRTPEEYGDGEIFRALCVFGGKKLGSSPVLSADPERGRRLFCGAWKAALAYRREGRDLFSLCFGEKRVRPWYPLSSALIYGPAVPSGTGDRDYVLDGSRLYRRRHGTWTVETYEKLTFDRERFRGFLHEADARFRRWLKTGRYLRESPADAWAAPYIDAVIAAEEKARLEAARPKITIDFSGLEQIRRDAGVTRESLLTEAERDGAETPAAAAAAGPGGSPAPQPPEPEPVPAEPAGNPDLPLDALQIQLLRTLLAGGDPAPLIRERRLMPSVLADAVNEALFDEIGDTVLLCEDDRLILVDDYIGDLEQLLG